MKQRLQSGLRFLAGNAGLHAAEDLCPAKTIVIQPAEIAARQIILHGDWDADLRCTARLDPIEPRGADADDGQCTPVDTDLLADYKRVGRKARAPVAVAEHRQRMAALDQVVRSSEHAPGS